MAARFSMQKEKREGVTEASHFDNLHNLSHMEKMAAIGHLAASVAHEMRNLLGMIRTAAFNIDRSLKTADSTTQKNLEIITRSVLRAREFIDNLLNLSRVSVGKAEEMDICEAVDNLLLLFSKELEWRRIELVKQYQHLPRFRIDRNAFQECLLNLILNAIQSMDRGGRITVGVESWIQGVRICIQDTGCGIKQENLKRIFDQFFTTKKSGQGTGLGLTIAQSIAKELGGNISVESRDGEGSIFYIELPYLKAVLRDYHEPNNDYIPDRERKTG